VPPLVRELVVPAERGPAAVPNAELAHTVLDALGAAPTFERPRLLEAQVQRDVKSVLGLSSGEGQDAPLDPHGRFSEMGMDSLMAVELKNRLQRELGVRLSPTAIFNNPSVTALTAYLVELLSATGLFQAAPPAPKAPVEQPAQALAEPASDELSEDAMIELIARKYESRR
jgi:acyl carrier protein